MKLKPFFTYYGGKYRIAPKYPKPRYATLIEPFAGSAGYSLRYPEWKVRLYEVNPKVYGTWKYLLNVKPPEILRLPLVFDDVRDLKIPQEAKWLVGWWLNKGHVQPCNLPGQWMRQGTRPNSFWGEAIRERVASQLTCIRHWKVFEVSFESILQYKASWFVDPPYQRSGKSYPDHAIDYSSLAQWVRTLPGQVIVCEQEGANWLPFRSFVETRGTGGYKMPGTSKEVIWTKGHEKWQRPR
jgi:hypothetical protein